MPKNKLSKIDILKYALEGAQTRRGTSQALTDAECEMLDGDVIEIARRLDEAVVTAQAGKISIQLPTVPRGDGYENGIYEDVADRLTRLMKQTLTEGHHSERESFVAENMLSENFEMLDWDANVFACTLGQMLAMLKRYGVRLDEPSTKTSSQGVAVDQNYFWDEDMSRCQRGVKYQLLGKGGMPEYKVYDGDPFWVAYALLPKRREPKKT